MLFHIGDVLLFLFEVGRCSQNLREFRQLLNWESDLLSEAAD